MRDVLTFLAIVLIVILTTVLVAPYVIDWTGQRTFLERRLAHALGQRVTIGGHIDLKLLPTPYLVLDQVVVGDDEAPFKVGIHHLDLELTVAPLLHGEFDIVEARLEEPMIRVTLKGDRTFPSLPKAPAFEADVRFDRIHVANGTLSIADPTSGRTFVFDHLDLDADAGSFAGPFKVNGAEGPDDRRTPFRLQTSTAEQGRARARLVIDATERHAGFELDGTVDLPSDEGDGPHESFEGNLIVSGRLPQIDEAGLGWKLSGPFKVDPSGAKLDGGEFRLGSDDAGISLQAQSTLELGGHPKLTLDLSAKQVDFDRLSGAPLNAVKPPPPKLPNLTTVRRLLANAETPIPTGLNISIDDATYGGEALSDLQAHVGLGDIARQPLTFVADGPGGLHLALDGTVISSPRTNFAGLVDIEAADIPHVSDWLNAVAPSFPWKGSDLQFKTVKLEGPITADAQAIESRALTLTLDRSRLTGTTRLSFGEADRPPKITADLATPSVDLDRLSGLGARESTDIPFDLDLRLSANAIKVAQLGAGAFTIGPTQIAITKAGEKIDLKQFHARDFGGATIDLQGVLEPGRATLGLTLDAARLDAAVALARQIAPGPSAEALAARGPTLAPAHIKIDGAFASNAKLAFAPTRLSIDGIVGGTNVTVALRPDTSRAGATVLSGGFEAADGAHLLAQLLARSRPTDTLGASHIKFAARGPAGDPLEVNLTADLGPTTIDIDGHFDVTATGPTGSGALHLKSPDLTPFLAGFAAIKPDAGRRVPAEASGIVKLDGNGVTFDKLDGHIGDVIGHGRIQYHSPAGDEANLTGTLAVDHLSLSTLLSPALGTNRLPPTDGPWSAQPFSAGLADSPRSAFDLEVTDLDIISGLALRKAHLQLGIEPNLVRIAKLEAQLRDGDVNGEVLVRRDGRQALTEGKIRLEGVKVRHSHIETSLDARLEFAGGASSPLALMSGLAGSGDATANDLKIDGGDPTALPTIFKDIENDTLAVDRDTVVRAFAAADKDPLRAGTRHFGLSLAAGILHFDPKPAGMSDDSAISTNIDALLDLTQLRLEGHLNETLKRLPKDWSGPPPSITIALTDEPGAATNVDVDGFLSVVAARALARETARLEAYEFDIKERALFNTRLQLERRREEERQKAEADRKARLEAARQERARKEQAAKEQAAKEQAAKEQAAKEQAAKEQAAKAAQDDPNKAGAEGDKPGADRGPAPPDAASPSDRGR